MPKGRWRWGRCGSEVVYRGAGHGAGGVAGHRSLTRASTGRSFDFDFCSGDTFAFCTLASEEVECWEESPNLIDYTTVYLGDVDAETYPARSWGKLGTSGTEAYEPMPRTPGIANVESVFEDMCQRAGSEPTTAPARRHHHTPHHLLRIR